MSAVAYAIYAAVLLAIGLTAGGLSALFRRGPSDAAGRSLNAVQLSTLLVGVYVSGGLLAGAIEAGGRYGLDGLSLVLLQAPVLFLVPGVLGRPLAALYGRLDARTPLQVLRCRYPGRLFPWVYGAALAAALVPLAAAELARGGLLLRAALGLPAAAALLLFGLPLLVPLLAAGGAFLRRAVPLQVLLVLAGSVLLVVILGREGGGIEALTRRLFQADPARIRTLEPAAAAALLRSVGLPGASPAESTSTLALLWVLAGVGGLGLPHLAAVPPLAASSGSLRFATVAAFLLGGLLLLLNGLAGAWAPVAAAPGAVRQGAGFLLLTGPGHPLPVLAGLTFLAPVAAVQAGVGFLLLLLALTAGELAPPMRSRPWGLRLALLGFALLAVALAAAVGLERAVNLRRPFDAALPAVFFPPLVLGLFWKRSRTAGALAGMAGGIALSLLFVKGGGLPSLPLVPALVPLAGATAIHALVCWVPARPRRAGRGS